MSPPGARLKRSPGGHSGVTSPCWLQSPREPLVPVSTKTASFARLGRGTKSSGNFLVLGTELRWRLNGYGKRCGRENRLGDSR